MICERLWRSDEHRVCQKAVPESYLFSDRSVKKIPALLPHRAGCVAISGLRTAIRRTSCTIYTCWAMNRHWQYLQHEGKMNHKKRLLAHVWEPSSLSLMLWLFMQPGYRSNLEGGSPPVLPLDVFFITSPVWRGRRVPWGGGPTRRGDRWHNYSA